MKKILNILLLLILLVSLVSCASRTGQRVAPFDPGAAGGGFRAGLSSIENFFSGGWQNYERTTAFVIFFFLFYSAFLIGAKKAFAGELTRAHKVFAFVAALLSASIIATTMRFDWVNLEYVAWGLIAVLVLFLIHTLLLKLGLEKHKFLAFLLALLIAALLLGLIWYLMNEGRPLSGVGRVSDWFRDLGARAGGIGGGEGEPIREPLGEGPLIGRDDGGEGPEGRGWLRYWWVIIPLIALIYGGKKGRDWWKGRRPREGREGGGEGDKKEKAPEKIEDIARVLLNLLDKLIKIQEDIMKGFKDKIKHGILLTKEESKGYNFPDSDIAWFYKEENRENTRKILEEINKSFEYNKGLIEKINEGLKLDAKEMEVLKYLAQELQKEEESLRWVREYHKGEGPSAALPEAQVREFKIKEELNERLRSEIIVGDEEMKKYLRQMLAPVLVRLYQLFNEFRDTIVREQNEALTPLNETASRLLKEQEGEIQLERDIKNRLDSNVHKFITFVKEQEWVLYKNLERDHDDKAEAKRDLEKEVWKRKKLKEEEGEKEEEEEVVGVIYYTDLKTQDKKYFVLRDSVKIGRSRDNDIVLRPYPKKEENLQISREHAVIEKEGNKFYITNNSDNGLTISTSPMSTGEKRELDVSTAIRFPPYFVFLFQIVNKRFASDIPPLPDKLEIIYEGEKSAEEEKDEGGEKPSVKGGIKPVKVPRFARTESDMIGMAVNVDSKKLRVTKEALEETYNKARSIVDEINKSDSKEIAESIVIKDNSLPKGVNFYTPRREKNRKRRGMGVNPYFKRNIFWVIDYLDKIYGSLDKSWDSQFKRIQERIEIAKELGTKKSPFSKEAYKDVNKFLAHPDASELYTKLKRVTGDDRVTKRTIDKMQKLDKAWQSWWNIFVLGIVQMNKLIRRVNKEL